MCLPRRPHRISIDATHTLSLPIYHSETSQQGGVVPYSSSNTIAIVGTTVGLIEKVTELLMHCRQSSIGYRDLALELESIQMYEKKPLGQSLASTITPEVLGCLFTLWELLDRIDGTWLDLSITSVGGFWCRIWKGLVR
jgi:hypothetical protein